ncbi:uncharacterized protein LODBEIA_P27360 [Lodderomyces beijingensis]|uniref:Pru domain-containing protein n=1 Tax=Lodderomyces beijingensis TaxID=1775926 RepID=A0ABP0ZMC7_9ASCO
MAPSKSLKFHAGKIQYDEETNRCTPLPYKGVISIKPSAEEPDFLDFTWTPKQDQTQQLNQASSSNMDGSALNGSTPIEKDELLLIPGDVTIKIIKSCNTGRVFAFTFMSSGAKYLYWLQDVGDIDNLNKFTDKDNKLIQQISELVTANDDEDDEEEEHGQEQSKHNDDIEVDEPVKASDEVVRDRVASQPESTQIKLPISSISSVLDIPTIEAHLSKLSLQELKQMYGEFLPATEAQNPTKDSIINNIVRSGFFQQCEQKLSHSLASGDGAGYLLAQSLKYDYQGEGIENFLNGVRKIAEKEDDEKKD